MQVGFQKYEAYCIDYQLASLLKRVLITSLVMVLEVYLSGSTYFATFINDASNNVWPYSMKIFQYMDIEKYNYEEKHFIVIL